MKTLIAVLAGLSMVLGVAGVSVAAEDHTAACKKQAAEKKVPAAEVDKFVKECMSKQKH